jgi:hypothetical protein
MTFHERQVLETALNALHHTTGLRARKLPGKAPTQQGADALVEIKADHRQHQFLVVVKNVDRFQTPAIVKAHLANLRKPILLVAPYITRETAERCRDMHLPFIDTAGNVYLEAPGLHVYVAGQQRPPELKQERFRALNAAGLQITFALLCRPELIRGTYREIATAAEVAVGTVGPVIKDLEARGLVRFEPREQRHLLDPQRLLQEWATHYPTRLRPKLNPRRFQVGAELLPHLDLTQHHAYWGGEIAAQRLTRHLKPATFTIYAQEPITKLVAASRMRADRNGNTEILGIFWGFGACPDYPDLVPPVLTYADLLATNDGRNTEVAKLIYEQRIEPTFHHAE